MVRVKAGDRYQGMPYRHCILMNGDDLEQAGLTNHQRVSVGGAGQLENIEIICGAAGRGFDVLSRSKYLDACTGG